ncbi:carbohydrate ABC transporter permease [Dactylosporangium sp. NPDC051541]|uniref:carbohydrate ABC transporter permease n=1 Tax=Dactylosporangium sp. NPDC051541 TaxID=3363977 RepID=UPI0037A12CE7
MTARRGDGRVATLFLAPAAIGFAVFYLYPSAKAVWYSLTDWNLLSDPEFVGLDNYREVIRDARFWGSLWVTVKFVVYTLVSQLVLALGLAAVMHRLTRSVVLRALLLVPWLVPNVTIGLLWLFLLDTNVGFVNGVLEAVGLPVQGFLTSTGLALPSIAGITTWAGTGYVALLLYAGMLQIPQQLYDTAALDGAGELRMFFRITLPLLRPILALVLVVSIIGSFQVFDVVAVTTQGRPVNLTRVIYYAIYNEAFQRFRMGYAMAMAMALVLLLAVFTVVQMRLLRASRSDLS